MASKYSLAGGKKQKKDLLMYSYKCFVFSLIVISYSGGDINLPVTQQLISNA